MSKYMYYMLIVLLVPSTMYFGWELRAYTYNIKTQPITVQPIQAPPINNDIDRLLDMGEAFADNHTYNRTGYNCVNYSNDFYEIIKEYNYSAEIVWGCRLDNKTRCHQWLRFTFDYEPVYGSFIDYSDIFDLRKD